MPAMESTIDNLVLQQEAGWRLAFFGGIFIVMLIWELLAPKRRLTVSKLQRWLHNIGLLLLGPPLWHRLFG